MKYPKPNLPIAAPIALFAIIALVLAAIACTDTTPSPTYDPAIKQPPADWNEQCEETVIEGLTERAKEHDGVYVVRGIEIIGIMHYQAEKWGGLANVRTLTDIDPADTAGDYIGDMLLRTTTWGWIVDFAGGGCRIHDMQIYRDPAGENA